MRLTSVEESTYNVHGSFIAVKLKNTFALRSCPYCRIVIIIVLLTNLLSICNNVKKKLSKPARKKTLSPGPEAGAASLAGMGWRSRDEGTSLDFLIRESETKEKWDFDCEPFEVPTFGLVWKQNGCIRSALTSFCWFLSFSFKRLPYFRKPSINKNHPKIKNWILIQRCLCFLSPYFTLPSFPAFSVGSKNTSIGTHTFQNDSLKRNEDASVT